jgi:hypothetical protein
MNARTRTVLLSAARYDLAGQGALQKSQLAIWGTSAMVLQSGFCERESSDCRSLEPGKIAPYISIMAAALRLEVLRSPAASRMRTLP